MTKPYFRLANDCFLVEGAKDAAVYDVTRARVLLLDERLSLCLRRCEQNMALDETWCDPAARRFLEGLCEEGLGVFDDAPAYVDKFRTSAPVRFVGTMFDPAGFHRLTWSITSACDWRCDFCPRRSGDLVWKGCMICTRRGLDPEAPLSDDDVRQRVEQIGALGIRWLHVRGGNPLLRLERLRTIASAARAFDGLTVIVTTPGTGCAVEDALTLGAFGNVRFNIVWVPTGVAGAAPVGAEIERTVLAAALRHAGIRITVTRLDAGGHDRAAPPDDDAAPADGQAVFAGIRTASALGSGATLREFPEAKRLLSWSGAVDFYNRIGYSVCGVGHCEIGCDGTVYPCAAIDDACGVADGDLSRALAGPTLYERWWRMGKDQIEPCRRCALRYACIDCTAVAATRPDGMRRCCAFDPDGAVRVHEFRWIHPDRFLQAQQLLGDSEQPS